MAGTGKRLLLVTPQYSYRVAAYIRAAQALGVELQIASNGQYSLVSELAAGLHIDLHDSEQAITRILDDKLPIHGVIATDDITVGLAAKIAAKLGLTHNSPHSAATSRRKDWSRDLLARAGLPIPKHRRLDLQHPAAQINEISFPCVVKPLSLSASTGVIRANNPAELRQACERIRPIVAHLPDEEERRYVLVEDYIEGVEVAVEGLVKEDSFQLLAIFDKPDPLQGPYFEETLYVTPSRLDAGTQALLLKRIMAACRAMGIVSGPVHAELRLDGQQAWILELASRTIGGDCGHLIEFLYEHSLEELVVANALDMPLAMKANNIAAGVMMIPTPKSGILKRVEGLLAAQKIPFVESVQISVKQGHELVSLPEGASYLGFIFAKAPTPQQTEAALRAAHAELNIVVAPLWKIGGMESSSDRSAR